MTPRLSLVMAFYQNPTMLRDVHYATWVSYPPDVKDRIEIVIVDDGSPTGHAADVPRPDGLPPLRIFRVLEDVAWRQHGARNVGAHEAAGEWLLLTDMDHVVPADTMRCVLALQDGRRVYTFARLEADTMRPTLHDKTGQPKPHPNSFAMTRALYWRIGGYDERLTGYGTDGYYTRRAKAVAHFRHLRDAPLIRYRRELVPDCSTTTLPRKEGRAPDEKRRRHDMLLRTGGVEALKVLTAPYERVA